MCYNQILGGFIVVFAIALGINLIYAYFALYGKIRTKECLKWRYKSVETSLTPGEFIPKVQKICLYKKWNIVELTEHSALIRTYPSAWSWGYFFYIEYLPGTPTTVTVYCRGSLVKGNIYPPILDNLTWMFYKL